MKAIVFVALVCLVVATSAINAHRRAVHRNIIDSDSKPPGTAASTAAPAPTGDMAKKVDRKWPNFEVKGTSDKKFHLVLKAGNAETIVTSEVLEQKASARKTIRAILRAAFNPKLIETKNSADGKFMFNLKSPNNQVVGTSETYNDKSGLEKGIRAVTSASLGFLLKFIRAAEANKEAGKPSVKHFPAKGDAESGKFYAHIKAGNNEIILNTGAPAETADAAFEQLAEIIGHALGGKDAKWKDVEQKESNGKAGWRGLLLNANDKEIARTEVYSAKDGLATLKSKTLPNVLTELFKTYWKSVIEDKSLQENQDDSEPAPVPSATPSTPAPSATDAQTKGVKEEEEEF